MSINVTVTGNPVSIKRGKMVCCDPYKSKKELEKRRLMRLEQVRQQSKDIAEKVRCKVQNEKCKQLCEIENEGKEKLKKWKTKKLLELQNQYKEAIRDIGVGHKEAAEHDNDSELILEQTKKNEQITKHRGQKAAEKLQVEKNEANYKQALPKQQRKIARDIENTRATLVSNMNKKPKSPFKKKRKRRKPSAEISIVNEGDDSDSESDTSSIPVLDIESSKTSSANMDVQYDTSSSFDHSYEDAEKSTAGTATKRNQHVQKTTREQQTSSVKLPGAETKEKSLQALPEEVPKQHFEAKQKSIQALREEVPKQHFESHLDTRISDRIKRRALTAPTLDFCDVMSNTLCACDEFTYPPCSCKNKRVQQGGGTSYDNFDDRRSFRNQPTEDKSNRILQERGTSYSNINIRGQQADSQSNRVLQDRGTSYSNINIRKPFRDQQPEARPHSGIETQIPDKPKVVLDTSKENLSASASNVPGKINYYDHNHRYSKEYTTDTSHVEKIRDESLRLSPGTGSEVQYYDKVYQRDKEAQIRGQKALEKERIHREYRELLKKLPALQRQERINEISSDKPEYHMSEERLQERERRRQNRMENAYEKAFPHRRPAVVTIPPKVHDKPNVNLTPFKIVDASDGTPTLNLGQWGVETPPSKSRGKEGKQTEPSKDRREELKELLQVLQEQKKLLLEEIKTMPKDSNLHEVLESLSTFSVEPSDIQRSSEPSRHAPLPVKDAEKSTHRSREKSKRRRSPDELASPNTTAESVKADARSLSREERYKKRHEKCFITEPPASPSPRKKAKTKKYKKRVLILQNCSTQTTPTMVDNAEAKRIDKSSKPESDKGGKVDIDKPGKPDAEKSSKPDAEKSSKPDTVTSSDLDLEAYSKVDTEKPSRSDADKLSKPDRDKSVPEFEKLQKSEDRTSKLRSDDIQDKSKVICTKKHVPCDCYKNEKTKGIEDLCQIVIKIREDDKPQILVQPVPGGEKKVTVLREISQGESSTQDGEERPLESRERRHRTKKKDEHKPKKDTEVEPPKKPKSPKKDKPPKVQVVEEEKEKIKKTTIGSDSTDSHSNLYGKSLPDTSKPKTKSWREQLSKISSEDTTTTSYYSPPDFKKKTYFIDPQAQSTITDSIKSKHMSSYHDVLKKKPQQQNIYTPSSSSHSEVASVSCTPSRNLDPKLLKYIKKLITMSRVSVDDLAVSTVSEVSTPSQSIMDVESNKPLNQLQNILKHFSIDVADLQHHLSISSDGSNAHLKAHENLTLSSSDGSQIITQNRSYHKQVSTNKTVSQESVNISQSDIHKTESFTAQNIKKYTEIAESCNKRISNLTAMIQKVREEKMKMLQSPTETEPDQSTKYLNLPQCGVEDDKKLEELERKSSTSTSTSTSTDDELERQLLRIDYELSEKLKRMPPEEVNHPEESEDNRKEEESNMLSMTDSDRQLFLRLQKLLQSSDKVIKDAKQSPHKQKSPNEKTVNFCLTESPQKTVLFHTNNKDGDNGFVPLLLDIPKLPKLTVSSARHESGDFNHRRPPPSKGLSIVRRINADVAIVPHELSTIIEADSQVSTRIEPSPRGSKTNLVVTPQKSPEKDISIKLYNGNVDTPDSKRIERTENKTEKQKQTSMNGTEKLVKNTQEAIKAKSPSSSDQSLVNMLNELNKTLELQSASPKTLDLSNNIVKPSTSSSSDDRSDMESVEKMLHSIGMDWAIATLRKTKEALALSSSTSSLDVNIKSKKKSGSLESSSDVSLKEFLSQQLIAKISSSTLKSDASPGSLLGESQELSAIQRSVEKSHQHTSTPKLSSSKSGDKQSSLQKIAFTGESDISSVRDISQDVQKQMTFHTLSEASSHS